MRFRTHRLNVVLVIAMAAASVGLALHLARVQQRSQSTVESDFSHRAQLTAKLTSAALVANLGAPPKVGDALNGPADALGGTMAALREQSEAPAVALFDAHGNPLNSSPAGVAGAVQRGIGSERIRAALHRGMAVSNVTFWGPNRTPTLAMLDSVKTDEGPRVLAELFSAKEFASASAYIAEAPGQRGATAYLLDGAGRVLASSNEARIGSQLRDRTLATAVRRHRVGQVGNNYFVDAPVRSGSRWQVVFWVPMTSLLAAVTSANGTDWLMFAALIAALLAFLSVTLLAGRKSAQLVRSEERTNAAQQLARARLRDPVTGLPSRELFLDRVEKALKRDRDTETTVAVLFVDLDGFKRINDSLGHAAGDQLLHAFGTRLREVIGPLDTVSRFGGDEFLVLGERFPEPDAAVRLADAIRSVLDQPFQLGSRPVRLTCSVGIAIKRPGDPAIDSASLVRRADAAMYDVKTRRGGGVRMFDRELHDATLRRLDTELALRAAISAGELVPYYQPIVELAGGRIHGVEALARWERSGVGLVMPADFIEMAETCGLIDELGRQILARAMGDVDEWLAAGLIAPDFRLSVNMSPRQLDDPSFYGTVARLLKSWSLPPSSLCLEITESAVAYDRGTALEALTSLSELGLKLAIDDFGVGQSSLTQIVRTLPLDVLKLDRTFVAELSQPRDRAVVTAVATMAEQLCVDAIAEGVETEEQASALLSLGYKLAQGYMFGHPMAANRICDRLSAALEPVAEPKLVLAPAPKLALSA
jgi:diguanylate cyclase (GGDEF)-like protein